DAGSYHVVVSDASGSINSRTGVVTVNLIFPDSFSTNTIIANVLCALPLPDGKTLIGGNFVRIGNQDRIRLARFNADGTLDSTFPPGASNTVYALSLQPDGRMLVGGAFNNLAGQPCANLGRLNPDASFDSTFAPSPNGTVNCVTPQPDGKLLIGGSFTSLG